MTSKFLPHKEPKKETTLARLTRQGKVLEKMVSRHHSEVSRELDRVDSKLTASEGEQSKLKAIRSSLFSCFMSVG